MLPRNIDLTDQRLFQRQLRVKTLPISRAPVSVKLPWYSLRIIMCDNCVRCGRPLDHFPWSHQYRELCDYCENEFRKTPWFFSPQMSDSRDQIFWTDPLIPLNTIMGG